MQEFRNIGVFLTEEPGDDEAVAFAAAIAKISRTESILCVHVRGMEDPTARPSPAQEQIREMLRQQFPADLADRTAIEIHENTGVREILASTRDKGLDLVVVGRRMPHDQMAVGSAFTKLARKAPCSVLVAPDQSVPTFERLLVPSDASEHSLLALQNALDIARSTGSPDAEVILINVFTVGYGYSYTGLTLAEAIEERKQVLMRQMRQFASDVDTTGVKFEILCISSESPTQAIYDLAASRRIQMILMGSRGRTPGTATLLGTFAERVLVNCPQPIMIVKRKGETLRFLDAFLSD